MSEAPRLPACGAENPPDAPSSATSVAADSLLAVAARRGAQDRHHPLLRPRRLHRHERGRRPRGRRPLLGEYFARATQGDRVPRRHRREVHRRRRGRRLRRARRARGRPRARRARRPAHPRGARGHDPPRRHARSRPAAASTPARPWCASTSTPPPAAASSPATPSTSPPGCEAAAPPGGVVVGALTHELTERVDRLRGAAARQSPRASPSRSRRGWRRAPVARRGARHRRGDLTPLVGREVELAYLSAIFDKVVGPGDPAVRASRRRARHRQEPPRARAARLRRRAARR